MADAGGCGVTGMPLPPARGPAPARSTVTRTCRLALRLYHRIDTEVPAFSAVEHEPVTVIIRHIIMMMTHDSLRVSAATEPGPGSAGIPAIRRWLSLPAARPGGPRACPELTAAQSVPVTASASRTRSLTQARTESVAVRRLVTPARRRGKGPSLAG